VVIMGLARVKVPAALASGILCLLLGGGLGAVAMWAATGNHDERARAAGADAGDGNAPATKGPNFGSKGGPGGPGGNEKKGGQRGPNPKTQLAQLVTKLDTLTKQSLHVELTADQKKQAKEQLADLAGKDAITDEEAKAKLEALLKLLEPSKKTLEDAGYRWPGGGGGGGFGGGGGPGGGGGNAPPNPFKAGAGESAKHLESLQTTLGK
jgi:hypothetical protein